MARQARRRTSDDDNSGSSDYGREMARRPTSPEEAARPLNPDYVPRYEDGTEKPKYKWTVLEQEMFQANHSSPEAIRAHTDHLGPSARVGLDPRGPVISPENMPEGSEDAPGSLDPTVPTGAPGEEKMEEQDQTGDQKVLEAKQM